MSKSLSGTEDRSRFVEIPFVIGKLEILAGAGCIVSPLIWSFNRRRSCGVWGLSFDCDEDVWTRGRSCCGGDEGRLEDESGGDGMVCMFELGPRRNGFLLGRERFSGEGGRSIPLDPLF